jgi:peptide/nickel transport system permease protein
MTSLAPATPARPGLLQPLRKLWQRYWVRALLQSLFTLWLVTTITFVLIRRIPGNPIDIKIQQLMNAGDSYQEAAQKAAGLFSFDPDAPLLGQYADFMSRIVRGDLGNSITTPGTTVTSQILRFLPYTLFSIGTGLLISFTLGTLIGVIIAYFRGSLLDNVVTFLASIFYGIPDFVIALLIILVGGVQLGLFKPGDILGGYDADLEPGLTWEFIRSLIEHVTLPVITYIITTIGGWILTMKSSTIATLGEDYITVAQARGLQGRRVLVGYVGRNALLPQVTRFAISIGFILGGSVIIENIFQYPGLGQLLIRSVSGRDYTTMQGVFLAISAAVILSNLLSDLLYGLLDPRVRVGERKTT